jgi:hypothetical protein
MFVLKVTLLILASAILAFSAPAPVPADLAAWYSGDGNANDISGNNLNPTTTYGSAKFAIGKVGQAMRFVPATPNLLGISGDGYGIADNSLLDIDGDDSFSAEFWSRTNNQSGTWIDKRELIAGQYRGYAIYKSFNGTFAEAGGNGCALVFEIFQPGLLTQAAFIESQGCSNNFTHYAFVYSRSSNELRIYVNGTLRVTRIPNIPIGDLSNTADFNIGQPAVNSTNGNWDGEIDELSVYKRALNPAEIQSIFTAGFEGKQKAVNLPVGMAVQRTVGDLTANFPVVTASGNLIQNPADPNSLPTLPSGFIHTGLAYEISTTAIFTGSPTLCFTLPSINDSALFARLRVMHYENSTWVNQTTTSTFATKTLCGQTSSFSPFAIAEQLAPSASAVSVRGRVVSASGRGIARARVLLTNQEGEAKYATTNQLGYFNFQEVAAGENYVVSVTSKRYQFNSQIISPVENLEGVNFIANE